MSKLFKSVVCICMVLSVFITPVYAKNIEYKYLAYDFSNKTGYLSVMNDDGNVYVNAKELADLLGFRFLIKNNQVSFYHDTLKKLIVGKIDSTELKVVIPGYLSEINYEAPLKIVQEKENVWIPFKYFVYLMDSNFIIKDEKVYIASPHQTLLETIMSTPFSQSAFDWAELGYSGIDVNIITSASTVINFLNGFFDTNDITSWKAIGTAIFSKNKNNAFDKKYSQDFARLICGMSKEEFDDLSDKANNMYNYISSKGDFTDLVKNADKSNAGDIEKLLTKFSDSIKANNNSTTTNGNSYIRKFLNAFQNKDKYKGIKSLVDHVQNDEIVKQSSKLIKAISHTSELLGYYYQADNSNGFAIQALLDYCNNDANDIISKDMMKAIKEEAALISSNAAKYAVINMLDNHKGDIALGIANIVTSNAVNTTLSDVIGSEAVIAKVVWNLAADVVPFIKEGLASADKFELATYGTIYQADLLNKIQELRINIDLNDRNNKNDLYKLCQYGYLYLKSCQITRECAIASLSSKKLILGEEAINILQEQANTKNKEFISLMTEFETITSKNKKIENKDFEFGFLLTDSQSFKSNDSDITPILADDKIIDLTPYVDSLDQMQNIVGGEESSETGDHEKWIIADNKNFQYGNYMGSTKVDEIACESKKYSLYGIYIDADITPVKDSLVSSGWKAVEEKNDYIEFMNEENRVWIRYGEDKVNSYGLFKDMKWNNIIEIGKYNFQSNSNYVYEGNGTPPKYYVDVSNVDGNHITFSVNYFGVNSSPMYITNNITVQINNNRAEFNWKDSFGNSGNGTIVIESKTAIKIMMKQTSVNDNFRGSLDTNGIEDKFIFSK